MKVHRSQSVRRAKVTTDGEALVSHAGTGLLAELADRSGLTRALSVAMGDCGISWHTHDPGVVLTHMAVAIADGADCLSKLAVLRTQEALFGPVPRTPRPGGRSRRWPPPSCGASTSPEPPPVSGCGRRAGRRRR